MSKERGQDSLQNRPPRLEEVFDLKKGEVLDVFGFAKVVISYWPYGDQDRLVQIVTECNCQIPKEGEGAFSLFCAVLNCHAAQNEDYQPPLLKDALQGQRVTNPKTFVFLIHPFWFKNSNPDQLGEIILNNEGYLPKSGPGCRSIQNAIKRYRQKQKSNPQTLEERRQANQNLRNQWANGRKFKPSV